MTSQVPPQEAYYYQDEIELREIIEIIRKRIWLVILLPLVAALVAFGVSKFIVIPEYEASTKIALGTFDHPIYGNVASSREILTSNDLLSEVLEDLRIGGQYKSVEEFAKLVSVDSIRDTRMLTISYHDNDPHLAREVVQTIAGHFMERSLAAYHQGSLSWKRAEEPADQLCRRSEYVSGVDRYPCSLGQWSIPMPR